jgi:hypothetical protein
MRIYQAHVSRSMLFFKDSFTSKFGLGEYKYSDLPTVFYGLYRDTDYQALAQHSSPLVVIWCGSDSLKLSPGRVNMLKSRGDILHYSTSGFIKQDLDKVGIESTLLPITPLSPNLSYYDKGDSIYCYGLSRPDFYNIGLAKRVASTLNLPLILTKHTSFNRTQLIQAYQASFVGLRLTPHDGVAITVQELGLMGRKCVFNGGSPSSLPWENFNSIVEHVNNEYKTRKKNSEEVRQSVLEYLNIGEEWLNL